MWLCSQMAMYEKHPSQPGVLLYPMTFMSEFESHWMFRSYGLVPHLNKNAK